MGHTNPHNTLQVKRLHDEIEYYVGTLLSCMDKSKLRLAYQDRRRSDRIYAYHEILRDACCMCFRSRYVDDSHKPDVYGFDGKVWSIISSDIFRDVVGMALVRGAGQGGDWVVKSDWVDKQSKLMESAYAGVKSSPLGCSPSVVGFQNGVWDFADVDNPVYHPFSDRLPVTELLPYDYDPRAVCPLWRSFLKMMLSKSDVEKLQKYLGLGIVSRRGMSHRVEDSLWLVGDGANGKSTIGEVIRAVFGYGNISDASMSQLFDRQPDARMRALYSIEGSIFNICDEADMQDLTKWSDSFKKLCSGEPQSVRGIGKDIHTAYDIPFLVFMMNQRPTNRRMDKAFRRRIVEIDFRSAIREQDMDKELGTKLLSELPGIRNWVIEGYKMLKRDDFRFEHTSDDLAMEANGQFLDIFLMREGIRVSKWAGKDEQLQFVRFSDLYDRYSAFCDRNLYNISSQKEVAGDLRRIGFLPVRRSSGMYYGVYSDKPLDFALRV